MGINYKHFELYKELYKEGYFKDIKSVLEFGSQDVGCKKDEIIKFLKYINKDENYLDDFYKKQGGKTIKEILRRNCSFSSKIIYEWLGIKEYESIDSDGKWNAKVFDLNKVLKKEYNYTKQFDLTTNIGTSEHIFNQLSFFKNMHDLTKEDGYMFHVIPFRCELNHCLYMYTPIFFNSLIKDNNYKVIKYWVINDSFIIKNIKNINIPLDNLKGTIWIFYFLKKTNGDFKIPFQRGNIYEEDNKLNEYDKSNHNRIIKRVIKKVANIKI